MTGPHARPHLTEDEHDVLRRALRQLRNEPRPVRPYYVGQVIYQAVAENA